MLLLSNCEKKDPDVLSVSPTEFTFTADDTEEKVATVTTNVDLWTIETLGGWVKCRKDTENDKLYISVENYNETGNPREANITVSAGQAAPVGITITQSARASLSISPESLSFDASETGSKPVEITTNASSWDAKADASWIKLEKQGTTLKVSVDANSSTSDRNAKITISAGNAIEKTVTVTQGKQNTLSVSKSSLTFESDETGEQSVTVTTTASSWNATTSASWLTLTKQSNTLKVSATANTGSSDRTATITVTAGNAPPVTVSVTQAKRHTLSVSPSSLSFTAGGDEKSVAITTTASSWNATTGASWITLSKQNNTLWVDVDANSSTSSRSATITVTAGNAPSVTVSVSQTGKTPDALSVSPTSLSFAYNATAQQTVTVTTNASSWNATTSVSWITLTKQSNTLRVSVTANSSATLRSATITFTAGSASSVTVSVSQAGVTSPSSGVVPDGIYSASGTPSGLFGSSPGPSSWTSLILNSSSGSYFTIANWRGVEGLNVWCDYKNGKIVMDGTTTVVNDNTNNAYGYFRVCTVSGNTITVYSSSYEYVVNYNSSTKTLDFSGTINGRSAMVGVVAISKSTGKIIGAYGDLYTNLKMKLTVALSSPQLSGDVVISADDLKKYKIREASILEMTNNTAKSSVNEHQIGKESLKLLKSK
jgi:hypothetical protein